MHGGGAVKNTGVLLGEIPMKGALCNATPSHLVKSRLGTRGLL